MQPLVEKHTGWTMRNLPSFRLVSRDKHCRCIASELQRDARFAIATEKISHEDPLLRAMSAGLLGRYSPATKMMYLLPDNLPVVLRRLGVEPLRDGAAPFRGAAADARGGAGPGAVFCDAEPR